MEENLDIELAAAALLCRMLISSTFIPTRRRKSRNPGDVRDVDESNSPEQNKVASSLPTFQVGDILNSVPLDDAEFLKTFLQQYFQNKQKAFHAQEPRGNYWGNYTEEPYNTTTPSPYYPASNSSSESPYYNRTTTEASTPYYTPTTEPYPPTPTPQPQPQFAPVAKMVITIDSLKAIPPPEV